MLPETKAQISRATLSLLTIVVSLFLLGILVFVLCVGLGINPFKETTTSFLIAVFVGLTGVAAVLVLLNVATSISLIADAKTADMKIDLSRGMARKWIVGFVIISIAIAGLIFAGTYLSKERYLRVVQAQTDEVLRDNDSLLVEMGHRLATGKLDDSKRVHEIRSFLETRRQGLPQLTVIYAGKFQDKLAFYSVPRYFSENSSYEPPYYSCSENVDCDYLKRFFSGERVDVLKKYTVRDDQFYIFIPVEGKESRFVLLFDRRNNYGKFGS